MTAQPAKLESEFVTLSDLRAATVARLDAHASAMNALLLLLDLIDGDPDLEPTLGAPESKLLLAWGNGFVRRTDGDQSRWGDGSNNPLDDDAEAVNEDGGDILEQGHL